MNRPVFAAIALSAVMALSSALPAAAMPTTSQPARASSQIEQVKVIIKYGNWRGHRGYRYKRSGYRRHVDGFWYPSAAFTVRVAPGVRVRVGTSQARWCRDRYRTYRVSDNTFITTGGVRRVCRVPF